MKKYVAYRWLELQDRPEQEYRIEYWYSPAEPRTSDYPGCPEDFEVHAVLDSNGKNVPTTYEDDEIILRSISE